MMAGPEETARSTATTIARCPGEDSRPAIIEGDRQVSYRDLRERVGQLMRGVRRELDRLPTRHVALVMPAGLDFTVAFLAALECGALVIPVDPALPDERLRIVLADCIPDLVIVDPKQHARVGRLGTSCRVLTVIELDRESDPAMALENAPWQGVLLYTSGSTGIPKGVRLPGAMLIREAITLIERLGIQPEDRISHLLSPSVIGGLREIFSALLSGATLVPLDVHRLGVAGMIRGLETSNITICRLVSTLFRTLCHGLPEGHQLAIRRMYIGGEPLLSSDVSLFRRHFPRGCRLDNVFGATEFGLCTHFSIPAGFDTEATDAVPIGHPNPGYELTVVDELGQAVLRGVIGRLRVAGECLAEGYQSGQSLDTARFSPIPNRPGWRVFQTEDLVRFTEEGVLEYRGRGDSQAKIRGNRVELGEVENCLLSAPDVLDAAVVDVVHDGQSRLYALVQRGESPHTNLPEWCRTHLSPASVPQDVFTVTSLPRSLQGKCDRQRVRAIVEQTLGFARDPQPALFRDMDRETSSTADCLLESIWRKVANLGPHDPIDGSTPVGGDSIALFESLLQIRKVLGVEITPTEFRHAETLSNVQSLIARQDRRTGDQPACVRLTTAVEGPPLFLMPMSNGECGIYRWLLNCERIRAPVYGVLTDPADMASESPVSLARIVTGLANSIQTQQTRGPYLLAGYSFGGVLAFEVARELSQRGGDVAYCGIVDSFLPFASRYQFQFRQLGPMFRNVWNWVPDFLNSGKVAREIRRWLSNRASPEGRLGNNLRSKQTTRDRVARQLRAMDEHTLNTWAGKVWFYHARVRPLTHSHNIESLWRSATGAEINSREIPGNHVSIVYPPRVDRLAEAMDTDIRTVLDQHRRG